MPFTSGHKIRVGIPHRKETRLRISLKHKGMKKPWLLREKHPHWKGDNVGYFGIHAWIKREKGKAYKCENQDCYYPRKNRAGHWLLMANTFQWANISRKYKRDFSDWIMLCASCHALYDRGLIKLKQ